MNFLNRLNLRVKLTLAFLVMGLIPMVVISLITWKNNSESLRKQAQERLTVIRETKAVQLENLFGVMNRQIKTLSSNLITVKALSDYSTGFHNYLQEYQNKPGLDVVKGSLSQYYTSQFGEEFKKQNNGTSADNGHIVNTLSNQALALQYSYISNNPNSLGSKHLLRAAQDGTSWSLAHKTYHPTFSKYLEEFGYYDIFLIEKESGNIVYSVFKELDFATSLKTGPYSETNFGQVVRKALAASSEDDVFVSDLKTYFPSYQAPAGFIASPVFKDGKNVGALVFQIPVGKINRILTNNTKWHETGFGDSGETYIIGKDFQMRSVSRFLVEDPEGFFATVKKAGASKEQMDYMRAKSTSAIALEVRSQGAQAVTRGETGFDIFPDYRGELVLSSYKPLNIKGLEWYLLAEMDEVEALAALHNLQNLLAIIGLICLGLIAAFALFISTGLSKSLSSFVINLKETTNRTLENSNQLKSASQQVSSSATEQASAIQETVATLDEIKAMGAKSVEYADKSTEKAQVSFDVASEGKNIVTEMSTAMNDISDSNGSIINAMVESNDEIGKLVQVINDIAQKTNVINDIVFQTKLLSFNASVEAARAGEHGKGFAVVAEEVGNLAQMSGNAAKEIGDMLAESIEKVETVVKTTGTKVNDLIDSSKDKVESGIQITQRCAEVLEEVVSNVNDVKLMMNEISSGSKEIAEGVSNISTAMNQLDQATQENSDVAHSTSAYSDDLANQAGRLDSVVKGLETTVLGSKSRGIQKITMNVSEDPKNQLLKSKKGNSKVTALDTSQKRKTPLTNGSAGPMKIASGSDFVPSGNDPRFEDV